MTRQTRLAIIETLRDPRGGYVSIGYTRDNSILATGHGYSKAAAYHALKDNLVMLDRPTGLPLKTIRDHCA